MEKTFKFDEQTSFSPSIRADYTWIKDRAYSETGSLPVSALLLNVNSRSTEELILGVNGKLSHKLGSRTTFKANAGVGYDVLNSPYSITASYAGASFITYGLDQGPWLARAGLGLVHKAENGTEINVRYDGEYRLGYANHSASVKLGWVF